MAGIESAVKAMLEAKDWASLINVITAIMKLVFSIVAEDEDLEYVAE